MSETVEMTEDLIEQARSERGGWTRGQLECLGVAWPAPSGWKRQAIGRRIDKARADRFLALKKVKKDPDQLDLF